MERGRSCRCCGCTMQFCPCCGAALAGKRDGAVKGHSNGNDGGLFSCNSSLRPHSAAERAVGSGASVPWSHGTAAWRKRLPRRPVSAYEVYLAAVHGVVADEGGKEAAAASRTLADPRPAMAAAEGGQRSDEQVRAAALSWLRMTPAEKRVYEEEAHSWQTRLGALSTVPPSAHNLGEDSSSATALPDALPSVERPLSQQQHSSHLVAQRSSKTPAPERLPRSKSSFALFRAHMKGRRKMCMRELCAVWRNMSAEEKAPYDAAAASKRTEQFLSQTLSAPDSQS
ncbi:hypothetical protein, unknown function [Leishmania infantum JPCM5]|uniref:Uncharacterized protein n=1 Tax=Leishmania infantum TaxID=5671 RepID=A4HZE9_LEIIN|nr:hypothetical protein, unknown function [Leishmania infantum JPCM5]CAM67861.1 hypothetical protein, unknown function [Leishmania infantum JPCM5]|eukprot:XP_001465440.1 hypothetical protein, unknown function [Leishmania infantum JPCM5]